MDDTDIKFLRISKEPTVDEKKKVFPKDLVPQLVCLQR